jgi:hypothetical protein
MRSHPFEPSLFAIGSKATHQSSALHIIDLTHESLPSLAYSNPDQTTPHALHSLPTSTISLTSLSWHPTESVLAATLPSGSLLLTRVGEHADGETVPSYQWSSVGGELILAPESEVEYSDNEEMVEHSFEDSFLSSGQERMVVDETQA